MHTAYLTHPVCSKHKIADWHPESPTRLAAIDDRLHAAHVYDHLYHYQNAPKATRAQLLGAHSAAYIDFIQSNAPENNQTWQIDPDTAMNAFSLDAALYAAGTAVFAVDQVMTGEIENAFCAIRPPGHHATRNQAMGFCIFNNVAIAAAHALAQYGIQRVAIVDFDVHHGNGTEDIFQDDSRVLFCSTFQHPFYPHSNPSSYRDHIIKVPLSAGTTGKAYREAFSAQVLPSLEAYQPEMIFLSAGFDSHREDDMGQFNLVEADYIWITESIMDIAARHAHNRIISILEGGYELNALGRSVAAHVKTLGRL